MNVTGVSGEEKSKKDGNIHYENTRQKKAGTAILIQKNFKKQALLEIRSENLNDKRFNSVGKRESVHAKYIASNHIKQNK